MTTGDALTMARVADLVRLLHDDLDVLSYYNLLGVPPGADDETVREAFHGRALLLHPDRYLALPDEDLRARIGLVYKRIAEAYRVLARPADRAAYDALLAQGQVRLTVDAQGAAAAAPPAGGSGAAAGQRGGPARPAAAAGQHVQSQQARQLYNLAKDAERKMQFAKAVTLLEQAVAVEPSAQKLRDALAEAQRLKKMYGG